MTQANEADANNKDNSSNATNPYQPPADTNVNNFVRRRSAIPGGQFWAVAVTAFALTLLVTFLTYGLTFPIVIALLAGMVRVCLIYWRRSSRGLAEFASVPLLFTSTLVALGLELSCAIAFGGVCTGGLFVVESYPGEPYGAMLTMTAAFALAGSLAFSVLLVWSIKWAS